MLRAHQGKTGGAFGLLGVPNQIGLHFARIYSAGWATNQRD